MFKVNNKNARRRSFPSVSIVDFEQVNVSWERHSGSAFLLLIFEKVFFKVACSK